MAAKDDLGRHGEALAAQFLVDAGYTVIDRNWRCQQGEIDIIARDGSDTVFIEVKTRSSTSFGHPFEAITTQKLARLRRLAIAWCEAHPRGVAATTHGSMPSAANRAAANRSAANRSADTRSAATRSAATRYGGIRIDAISVIAAAGHAPLIEHLKRVY